MSRASLTYILRRLVLIIPTLFGITVISFAVVNLAPGGPVEQKLQQIRSGGGARKGTQELSGGKQGQLVSKEVIEALKKQYGFDQPVHIRYWKWLKNVVTFEFGKSFVYGRPVADVIKERLPVSLQFGLASLLLSYTISIFLGLFMSFNENKLSDGLTAFALLAASTVPAFMLAILLLVFFSGGSFLDLFPLGYLQSENYENLSFGAKVWDRIHHFILPLTCYMIGSFTTLALLCRNSVLDEVRKDYVRTALAKGLSRKQVIVRHALRNGLIPVVTGIGGMLAFFLSGSLIVEAIFQLNGIGLLGFSSILARDYNVVMALIYVSSLLMLVGNLISDLVYMVVDPRIDFR